MSISLPTPPQSLSYSRSLSNPITPLSLSTHFSHLTFKTTPIRMGGGPRTFPGGVSKWQWKRMQAKKAKQLLKARLARERQIYEMRKRAELKSAVSELERPWETVERAPNLFSVSADEQLKVLADRFQKPGGLDLWSDRDGPELFRLDNSGLPSARFFPKGVVHSVKPYGRIADSSGSGGCGGEFESLGLEEGLGNDDGEIGSVAGMGLEGDSVKGGISGSEAKRNGGSRSRRNGVERGLGDGRGHGSVGTMGVRRNGESRIGLKGPSGNGRINGSEAKMGVRRDGGSRIGLEKGLGDGRGSGGVVKVGVARNGKSRRRSDHNSLDLDEGLNLSDLKSRGYVGGNAATLGLRQSGKLRGNDRRWYSDKGRNVSDTGLKSSDDAMRKGNRRTYLSDSEQMSYDDAMRKGNRRTYLSDSEQMRSDNVVSNSRNNRRNSRVVDSAGQFIRSRVYETDENMKPDVFDMSLRNDGTYGFELEN